jgi:20S proteasome alpha/beta subunit
MTICIAGICDNAIILCGDRELGISITSAEFREGKWMPLYDQWGIGISGTVDHATDVIAGARRARAEMESASSWDVQRSIARAYQRARMEKAEARFLANRGWTLEEFKKNGATQLSPSAYASIDAQVALYDFGADLILAGFGDETGPSIMTVRNPGICHDHTKIGFWCVGSGSTAAQMSLFERQYSWTMPPEEAAYYIYEAKVAAQKASGVGADTDLYLMRKGADNYVITAIQSESMKVFEAIRKALAPQKYEEQHQKLLESTDEFKVFRAFSRSSE